jgi:hypothetical protein
MNHRTFPAPWRVEPTEGGNFVVKDATGFSVCYVYAGKEEALTNCRVSGYAKALMARFTKR